MPKLLTKPTTPKKDKQQKPLTPTSKSTSPEKSEERNGSAEAKPVKKLASSKEPRKILYPAIELKICTPSSPLTVADAKKLLEWREETEHVKFDGKEYGSAFHTRGNEETRRRVWCANNQTNRPIVWPMVEMLWQEILRGNYQLNGETIIIGKTGFVLSGQNRLIALVLAAEMWAAKPGQYKEVWKTEPTITGLVVVGIDETDKVVNTIDTGKPRDMADVFYRSEFFAKFHPKQRKPLAKLAKFALKMLWHRTGADKANAFAPRQTHAESIDFVKRHPKLLEAVKHIYEENGTDGKINQFLSPGYAAALMYLQAACLTERERETKDGYGEVDTPSEKLLDMTMWDKSSEFWVMLAGRSKEFEAVTQAVAQVRDYDHGLGGSIDERTTILINTWNVWTSNKKVTLAGIMPKYHDGDDGKTLVEVPHLGGIDVR